MMSSSWQPRIDQYSRVDLRGVEFASDDDLTKGVALLMNDSFFKGMPFGPAGKWMFVLPAEGAKELERRGIGVQSRKLADDDPIPDEASVDVLQWTQRGV